MSNDNEFRIVILNYIFFPPFPVPGDVGMFMTEVAPGGVAGRAGVKTNDRLIEVNGENTENATHDQIIEKVRVLSLFTLLCG